MKQPVHSAAIERMTGRCHVGESVFSVLRYVLSRFNGGRRQWLKANRNIKRYMIAATITHHRDNLAEYIEVMRRRDYKPPQVYWFDTETKETTIEQVR